MKKVLIIDNYDSFTYNLFQYVGEIRGEEPVVWKNDAIDIESTTRLNPLCCIISPGPGHPSVPRDRGNCSEFIRELYQTLPILGICMGHQILAYSFGADIVHAPEIMHGKTSKITHSGDTIFRGIPENIDVMRYHSLIVRKESLPKVFDVIAQTVEGLIMGIKMHDFPVYGLQFHPESIGTRYGKRSLIIFFRYAAKRNRCSSVKLI